MVTCFGKTESDSSPVSVMHSSSSISPHGVSKLYNVFMRVVFVVIFVVLITSLSGFVFRCFLEMQEHIQVQTDHLVPQYFLVLIITSSFSSTSISGILVSSYLSYVSSQLLVLFLFRTFTLELFLDFDHGFGVLVWSLITVVFDHLDFQGFFLLSLFMCLTFVCSSSSFWFTSGKIYFKGLIGASLPTLFLTTSSCFLCND